MDVQKKTCFSIAGRNRPGEAARITAELMRANVDLEGLWGFAANGEGAEFMAVPREPAAFRAAALHAGWQVKEITCFRLTGEDRRGALVETLQHIADKGISLCAIDALALDGQFGCYLWADAPMVGQLETILRAA